MSNPCCKALENCNISFNANTGSIIDAFCCKITSGVESSINERLTIIYSVDRLTEKKAILLTKYKLSGLFC